MEHITLPGLEPLSSKGQDGKRNSDENRKREEEEKEEGLGKENVSAIETEMPEGRNPIFKILYQAW